MGKANLRTLFLEFQGTPFFIEVQTVTTPGITQTLFTTAVPTGKVLKLHHLIVVCRISSRYSLFSDTAIIASGRTGAGGPESNFPWIRPREITAGNVLKLDFKSGAGIPTPVDVEAYLQASLVNA